MLLQNTSRVLMCSPSLHARACVCVVVLLLLLFLFLFWFLFLLLLLRAGSKTVMLPHHLQQLSKRS